MLRSAFKKKLSQKKKKRNKKQLFLDKENSSLKPNNKVKMDTIGAKASTFLYNVKKRHRLNSLNEKTQKVHAYMNTLGESFKNFNRNINSTFNPLMISNLTKINYKRSLIIRNKIKNLDKLNEEYDKEYNNALNINSDYKYNNNDKKEVYQYQDNKEKTKKDKNARDALFKAESARIFNFLFKKDGEGSSYSDYKKNKKLNELKSSIDYICGVEKKAENGNIRNEQKKIPHYNIQIKSPSFIREKTKNASFTPSIRYNKSKVYYNKKYELSQEKINKNRKLFQRIINSKIQDSPNPKIKYKIKGRNINSKREENKNNAEKSYNENNTNNNNIDKINSKLPEIKLKQSEKSSFSKIPNIKPLSPKQRHISLEQNFILTKENNSSIKEFKNRCKTANNINHFKNNYNGKSTINLSNKKGLFPLLKGLLKDNYDLKRDLKLGFNIITNMINDFKKIQKKKPEKNELNIEQIRKDLKLQNLGEEVIDEIDVVMNNVKKMEKLVKKKDIYLLRKVAKTVIREDKLANKNLVFDINNINNKLKKIYERRNKLNNQDQVEENLEKEQRVEMIKLFKNDSPDFCNEEYLSNLLKRYKTLKIK